MHRSPPNTSFGMTSHMANDKILFLPLHFFLVNEVKQLAQLAAHVPIPVFREVFHLLLVGNKECMLTREEVPQQSMLHPMSMHENQPRPQSSALQQQCICMSLSGGEEEEKDPTGSQLLSYCLLCVSKSKDH